MMQFVSTRGGKDEISFEEAVFRGLAPDGGLYVPTTVPDLRALVDSLDGEITFTDLAGKLIGELL
ncbi:MAG TPA: threonine synthase, partial [Spirochaetia bacterium]|nr:threonine synthase [Spirochaetia bacterium]